MKKKRRIRNRRTHPVVKYLRGSATFSIILIVVIMGAVFLAGGIFPKSPGSGDGSGGKGQEGVIDQGSLLQNGSRDNLQLQTFDFKLCADTITMDLLLDRSGSMGDLTPSGVRKIDRLKEAVLALSSNLSDNSVIGAQSFATPNDVISITDDVPIAFYRDNKSQIAPAINSLNSGGATPTYEALKFAYQKLQEAMPRFPGRTFSFVLVSDGAPCPGVGCAGTPGANQDPRLYNPNPADLIKALGVNVYTLAIYDSSQAGDPALSDLLKSISSDPVNNYFQANTADDTTRLLTAITQKICGGQNTPAPQ